MVVAPPLGPVARTWAGFSTAVRLGWAVSSNWTRPLLFVIYIVLRPISAALILVVMYEVITGGRGSAFNYLSSSSEPPFGRSSTRG